MKVLITGAFGNVGTHLLYELISQNSNVMIRCLVRNNRKNQKKAKLFSKNVEIIWGDIRNKTDIEQAVKDQDIVIHLAAVIPPQADKTADFARQVNFEGTKNLLEVIRQQNLPPKLIFPSSVAVYGDVRHKGEEELCVADPFNPNKHEAYAQQKVECENLIRTSSLEWSIFRFGYIPSFSNLKFDPIMFDIPLDTCMEFIHVEDAATALTNALSTEKIWGKTLLVAGGDKCRATYKEFMAGMLTVFGVGPLPDEAFGDKGFHCGYMDTKESQQLLNYQKHTFNALLQELRGNTKIIRFFGRAFRPIAKWFLLRKSPYYSKNKRKSKTES